MGFAIRSMPVVQEEMAVVRRNMAARRQLNQPHVRLSRTVGLVESLLARTISRMDHMVSQLERRGFSPLIFGELGPLRWSIATILIGIATIGIIALLVLDRMT